jgi:fatty acid desaturase
VAHPAIMCHAATAVQDPRRWRLISNIDGGPLFHMLAGNRSFQVEHDLYPAQAGALRD